MSISEKELKLFKHFEVMDMLGCSISIPSIYRVIAEEAFVKNLKGPEVESIRRCLKALYKGDIRRMTPEWDALICFA
jgi:predicted RNase H-like nuclease